MPVISLVNGQRKHRIPSAMIVSRVTEAAARLKLNLDHLSVVFVSAQRMRRLHLQFLGKSSLTDVITFVNSDIIVCPLVASQNAKRLRLPYHKELLLYVFHGLLHLAGYDDKQDKDIAQMRMMEKVLMKGL